MKYETIMEIDLNKLKNNTKLLCKSYNDYKYKMVDLKDYGHGLGLKIADVLYKNGINYVIVGSLKEALEIRKFNTEVNILVNYFVTEDEIYDCINNNIAITIYNLDYLQILNNLELKDQIKLHILIDNGSNLLGINKKEEFKDSLDIINNNKYLVLEGIYTELTSSGVEDEYYYHQMNNFYKIIKDNLNDDVIIHLNEPVMYHKKLDYLNGIRFDLSILGIEENINDDFFTNLRIKNVEKKYNDLEFPDVDLELAFNITSEVMCIKKVKKGSLVGRNYVAKDDMFVAIIPIGHKDGITKAIKYVGIDNFKRNILSDEIDRLVVEVTEDVKEKDKVYILNEERGIYDFLTLLKTNRYYLMSVLNRNLTRVYINDSEENHNLL